jgi:hypothetical protein
LDPRSALSGATWVTVQGLAIRQPITSKKKIINIKVGFKKFVGLIYKFSFYNSLQEKPTNVS